MIATVTSSTVTSVTTLLGFSIVLGMIVVLALVAFLCVKELAAAGVGVRRRFLAKSFNVVIVPLVVAFVMIVSMKVVEIVS